MKKQVSKLIDNNWFFVSLLLFVFLVVFIFILRMNYNSRSDIVIRLAAAGILTYRMR